MSRRRSAVASVRFSPEEADRLRERARLRGLTLSELVRRSAVVGERVELPTTVTVFPWQVEEPAMTVDYGLEASNFTAAAMPTRIEWWGLAG